MAKETFLLKDIFNQEMISKVSDNILQVYSEFDKSSFEEFVLSGFPTMEFKERTIHICIGLEKYLPSNFESAIDILNKSLPSELPKKDVLGDKNYSNFYISSYGEFVVRNGMSYFNISINALKEQTKRLTAEFAIRPFIEEYPQKTLEVLRKWAKDDNLHVRRLVSEGSRPRLPWGLRLKRFIDNPAPVIELLEILKDDSESYVRRSVANSLNDIAKDNPNLVISTLRKWQNDSKEMKQMTSHALRTLIKDGNQDALKLFGYSDGSNLRVANFKLNTNDISLGDSLEFNFNLISNKSQNANIIIDYIIHYQKANGKLSPKVYKLSKHELEPEEAINLHGRREFKPISTRKFYSGNHKIEIIANGKSMALLDFTLIIDK